jgi:hypothetical protein
MMQNEATSKTSRKGRRKTNPPRYARAGSSGIVFSTAVLQNEAKPAGLLLQSEKAEVLMRGLVAASQVTAPA